MMETKSHSSNSIVGGVLLIALGLVFFVVTQTNVSLEWGKIWPMFVVLAGVPQMVRAFQTDNPRVRGGLVLGGTIPILLGVYFFCAMNGILSWGLWPVYPLILGVAFLAAYLASGLVENRYLIPGIVLSITGVVFMGIVVLSDYSIMGKIWPIFLVIGGIILLVSPRASRSRG